MDIEIPDLQTKIAIGLALLLVSSAIAAFLLVGEFPGSGGDRVRNHHLTCNSFDYPNVTYVPFESIDEQEQELLRPALESDGASDLFPEEAHRINHTYIEYENETYKCIVSVT